MASEPRNWTETTTPAATQHALVAAAQARAKTVWKGLEYSSAYLAVMAAMEVLLVQWLLALPPSPAPLVVALITFAIYANDRLLDLDSDAVSTPERTAFVRRYRSELYVSAAIAYGLAVGVSVFGGPVAFALALLPAVAWVLYAVGWVPLADSSVRRLKELIVVNSAIVGGAWALTIVFMPVAFAGVAATPAVWILFGYLAVGTFVTTEVSNARDVESDVRSGVATLPVKVGVRRTRHLLYVVSLLIAVMVGYGFAVGHLTAISAGALGIGVATLLGIVALLGRGVDGNGLSLAGEFSRVPVFAALLVASSVL
jgi:4-hydroxybenzoate polyprenyltransferase